LCACVRLCVCAYSCVFVHVRDALSNFCPSENSPSRAPPSRTVASKAAGPPVSLREKSSDDNASCEASSTIGQSLAEPLLLMGVCSIIRRSMSRTSPEHSIASTCRPKPINTARQSEPKERRRRGKAFEHNLERALANEKRRLGVIGKEGRKEEGYRGCRGSGRREEIADRRASLSPPHAHSRLVLPRV
jgi:hypothetical protein